MIKKWKFIQDFIKSNVPVNTFIVADTYIYENGWTQDICNMKGKKT